MRILLPVPSFFVTLVEKLPLSAFRFVIRVEKLPLSVFRLVTRVEKLELSAVILVANEELLLSISAAKLALATAKAPLMFEAICAEPLINVLDNSDSAVVNLSEILALGAVKDPDISSAN